MYSIPSTFFFFVICDIQCYRGQNHLLFLQSVVTLEDKTENLLFSSHLRWAQCMPAIYFIFPHLFMLLVHSNTERRCMRRWSEPLLSHNFYSQSMPAYGYTEMPASSQRCDWFLAYPLLRTPVNIPYILMLLSHSMLVSLNTYILVCLSPYCSISPVGCSVRQKLCLNTSEPHIAAVTW